MFTRCPQCKTVHPLTNALVSRSSGTVQCGQCNLTFNALDCLMDHWPSGQKNEPSNGTWIEPPVPVSASEADNFEKDVSSQSNESAVAEHQSIGPAWRLATALLILITIVNAAWTFREQLLEIPSINNGLQQIGWLQLEQSELLRDPLSIQLVSRDMHLHPTRSGILVLSLTIINLAQHSQVFPDLELTLLDAASQPVAQRRFQPADYLHPGANTEAGLAADVYLPVLLELGDPGQQAVGFEIRFL